MWTLENIHVNPIHQLDGSLATQNVVPGPVAWESPGKLLKLEPQIHPGVLNQKLQKHCCVGSNKKNTVTHYTTKSVRDYWVSVTQLGYFFFQSVYDINILSTFISFQGI